MMCYTPKWLWDAWEGGLVRTLSMGLHQSLVPEKDKDKRKKVLIDYLLHHCEVRNLFNTATPVIRSSNSVLLRKQCRSKFTRARRTFAAL